MKPTLPERFHPLKKALGFKLIGKGQQMSPRGQTESPCSWGKNGGGHPLPRGRQEIVLRPKFHTKKISVPYHRGGVRNTGTTKTEAGPEDGATLPSPSRSLALQGKQQQPTAGGAVRRWAGTPPAPGAGGGKLSRGTSTEKSPQRPSSHHKHKEPAGHHRKN